MGQKGPLMGHSVGNEAGSKCAITTTLTLEITNTNAKLQLSTRSRASVAADRHIVASSDTFVFSPVLLLFFTT